MTSQYPDGVSGCEESSKLVPRTPLDLIGTQQQGSIQFAALGHCTVLKPLGLPLLAISVILVAWNSAPSFFRWEGSVVKLDPDQVALVQRELCCGLTICLSSIPGSVCGPTKHPVICANGDMAAVTTQGFGYCCSRGTFPCRNMCLDRVTRQLVLNRGGSCNGEAPQGFRASNTIVPVSLPWDSFFRVYELDGGTLARLPSGLFQYGTGDFTLVANLSQAANRRFGFRSAVIFSKYDIALRTGFMARLVYPNLHNAPSAEFILQRGTGTQQTVRSTQLPVEDGARFPREYRFIRQNRTVYIFRDGEQVASVVMNATLNVDSGAPFTIGAQDTLVQPLLGFLSNMRSEKFADFP